MKDKNIDLKNYLATGIAPERQIAQDEAIVITGSVVSQDPMYQILAHLCSVEMLAKDFHYRAKGKPFYGNHLMADLIGDMSKDADDINEVYYMGELQQNPPYRNEVAKAAAKIVDDIPAMANEDGYIEALYDVCNKLVGLVEQAKEKPIKSGTTAILDGISQNSLQAVGFLKRVMTGSDMSVEVDADVSVL